MGNLFVVGVYDVRTHTTEGIKNIAATYPKVIINIFCLKNVAKNRVNNVQNVLASLP